MSRVDSVKILKSGDPGFDRLSNGKDTVSCYDLTVSGHPSFFVGDGAFLAHNCVDQDSSNDYNDGIYQLLKIDDAMIEDAGDPLYLIDPPGSHAAFDKTWIGMDVGWCVDTETEILTKRGWLSYDKLLVGDESLSIDPATGLSDWQTVTDIYSDTGLYAMAHMSADNFDAVTTLHHRWLVGVSGGGGLRWTTTEGLCSGDCVPSLSSFSGTNWIPLSDMTSFVDRKLRTIWCPTMANHQNWLARRNGSVYFTGNTTSPSAITVFAEEKNPDKSKESILRLISRILLTRVSGPDQVRIVAHLIDLYRPKAFAMDSTGAGQPLVQFLQEAVRDDPSLAHILDRIKGYNFSSNIVVDIDETKEMDQIEAMKADPSLKEMEVRRNVKEYSSDVLRELVDQGRLILPWDKDLIGEFQGETWGYSKKIIDHYGRRKIYSGTGVHSLDAARLGALAYKQQFIDEILDNHKNQWEPSPLIFL